MQTPGFEINLFKFRVHKIQTFLTPSCCAKKLLGSCATCDPQAITF